MKEQKDKKEKRIEEIKIENDQINKILIDMNIKKEELIKRAMINNGRILELQKLIKDGSTNKEWIEM